MADSPATYRQSMECAAELFAGLQLLVPVATAQDIHEYFFLQCWQHLPAVLIAVREAHDAPRAGRLIEFLELSMKRWQQDIVAAGEAMRAAGHGDLPSLEVPVPSLESLIELTVTVGTAMWERHACVADFYEGAAPMAAHLNGLDLQLLEAWSQIPMRYCGKLEDHGVLPGMQLEEGKRMASAVRAEAFRSVNPFAPRLIGLPFAPRDMN